MLHSTQIFQESKQVYVQVHFKNLDVNNMS